MVDVLYTLRGVRQAYAGRMVLEIEQLDVAAGDVLAVGGPSGAGKSTLLRLLTFLELPAAGRLTYHGREIPPEPPLALSRRVTMVFQRPVLLSGTVWDNVAYGLRLRGEQADGRVGAALERVGLAGLARQPAHGLSGGELQRTALARALVLEPDVLLLDEPTANLDPYNEEIISDSKLMKGYYDDYSPSRALEILRAIPTAWSQYEKFGGRWGPGIIGKLVNLNATTTGRYLHAFRKAGIKEIEGPTGEKITMP